MSFVIGETITVKCDICHIDGKAGLWQIVLVNLTYQKSPVAAGNCLLSDSHSTKGNPAAIGFERVTKMKTPQIETPATAKVAIIQHPKLRGYVTPQPDKATPLTDYRKELCFGACAGLTDEQLGGLAIGELGGMFQRHAALVAFVEDVSRSVCLDQKLSDKCICFSCEAKRIMDNRGQ